MAIPALNRHGELVSGEYEATLDEIETIFGHSPDRRKRLMQGLRNAAENLQYAGVKKIWVDGSFVTDKKEPNDIDGCWEYSSLVDTDKLDPVFLSRTRADAKKKYGLDFFVSQIIEAGSGLPFPKFFQVNRDGGAKGIIVVRLGD
jgi:hypothetical protein